MKNLTTAGRVVELCAVLEVDRGGGGKWCRSAWLASLFGGLFLLLASPTSLLGVTVTLNPASDAYVNDSDPTGTFNNAWLVAGRSPAEFTPRYRSFLRFDLSDIPSNAIVSSAVLRLNLQAFENSSSARIGARRVLASWSGGTLTWNNQAAFSSAPSASTAVGAAIGADYSWTVTGLVQDWVEGQFANYGLALVITSETTATATRTFASLNHTTVASRPELVVTYALPADIAVTPTSLLFGNQRVGTTSVVQNVTVRNSGGSTLWISNVTSSSSQFLIGGTPSFPASIGPGASNMFQVRFAPTSRGAKIGTVNVISSDPDEPNVSVSCAGAAVAPDIEVVPTTLAFANQLLGTTSSPQTVTIQNTGNANLLVTSIGTSSSQFPISVGTTLPATIAPGGNVMFQMRFNPTSTGAKAGTISIASDDPDESTRTVSCTGSGVVPDIDLLPTTLNFGNQLLGTTSAPQTITIQNTGSADVHVIAINNSSSQFLLSLSASLPITIIPGGSLPFGVRFAPTSAGAKSGSVTVLSDDPDESTRTVSCTGSGVLPDIDLAPTALNFGNQLLGTTSAPQTITIQNTGSADLHVTAINSSSSQFLLTLGTSLPATIVPGGSLPFGVRFAPTSAGAKSGSVTVLSDDPDESTRTVSCTGSGVVPDIDLLPTTLNFGNQLLGTTSAPQTITIQNTGSADLHVTAIASASSQFLLSLSASLPITIIPGGSLPLGVRFAPTSVGAKSGSVTVLSDDPDESTRTASCTGSGVVPDIDVVPTALNFGNQLLGTTSSPQTVTMQNTGSADLHVTSISTSSGQFLLTLGTSFPVTIAPGGSLPFGVQFAPISDALTSGTITIASDDIFDPRFEIRVRGTGTPESLLIPAGSSWRYLDDGSNQRTTWREVDFDDSTWAEGPAQLGYSEGDEATVVNDRRPLGSSIVTTYFRHRFLAPECYAELAFQVVRDDGAVVYLNGAEIFRMNMPVGVIAFDTRASSAILEGENDWVPLNIPIPPEVLIEGENLLAVEVHQADLGELLPMDLSFDLELRGQGECLPEITFTPEHLIFLTQAVNTVSAPMPVTVRNDGTAPLTVRSIVSESAEFPVIVGISLPATIAPGGNLTFQVRFSPTGTGTRAGTVTIASDDPDEPTRTLTCNGTGVAPDITVAPASLHFSMRALNTISPPENVTVRSDGTAPLSVQSIVGDSSEFPLSGLPTLPLMLNPGSSHVFQVRFAPNSAGEKSGNVRIQSNDPMTPLVTVSCDGMASTGPNQQPPLATEYASYAFTPTATGTVSSAQAVFLVNNTTQPRQVTSIANLPPGSPFQILNRVAPLPAAVPAGGRIKLFDVQFAPTELGSSEVMVQITTDVAAFNPVIARITGRGRHPSLADFYSDPRPFHIAFDQLKYSAGEDIWLSYEGAGPEQVRIYLASPAQDDIEAVDLVRAGVGPSCRQVQRIMVDENSAGHFDGTLAARPGEFIFAFVHDANSNRTAADYAFISGGAAQGLFSLALDPGLTPQPASVPGRPGESPRGLAAIADTSNYPGVFGDDQLIIEPRDLAELNDFVKRYDGRIVDDGRRSKPTSRLPRPYYLVRVNLDRADTTDFAFMAELAGVRGALRTSSDATRRLYSILIHEQLESRRVTLNPRVDFFSQPLTVEDASVVPGGGSDAFSLNYVRDCVQKMNRAWSYVALQDRDRANGVRVRLAILDDGFCVNPDLPMAAGGGWDLEEDDADPTGPRVTVFGADWHGTSVASAAASLHNNGLGSAGAGGQVADLLFYRLGSVGHAFQVGVALDMAVADGAQVVNMSFGIPCRVFGGPTFCELDNIGFWAGVFGFCPALEAALDLVAPFIHAPVTCKEFYGLMAAARSSMLAGVEDALDAGVCLVASAGNGNDVVPDSDISDFDIIPGSFDGVIAVGAMSAAYRNTEFFGNRVDVWTMIPVRAFAPDEDADECDDGPVIGDFGQTSGSSGFVAGIICLMRALNPAMTPEDIEDLLRLMPPSPADDRVERMLDAYALVRTAGTRAGLPDLQLRSPSMAFDESLPLGVACAFDTAVNGLWPPGLFPSDDTPGTANRLQLGANEFTDRAIHPFVSPASVEQDLYFVNVPANLQANAAYDVELQTIYPTVAGALLPHPDARIVEGALGLADYSSATYRRSGLFWRNDVFFLIQGTDPLLANQDNVYTLTANITLRAIEPDRYDRPPLGDPPNDTFADATELPNAPGGDEWDLSDDAMQRIWRMRVRDLNFHTPTDVDYFCVDLPPEALDDCPPLECECLRLGEGRLQIRVSGAQRVIKLDAEGQEIERHDNFLEYGCHETGDRAYFAVVGSPDQGGDYRMWITYILPDEGVAHRLCELAAVFCDDENPPIPPPPTPPPPSPDEHDVVIPGEREAQEFSLGGPPCDPIVCTWEFNNYLLFNWAETRPVELEFQHGALDQFQFDLLDRHFNVMARAERLDAPGSLAAGPTVQTVAQRLRHSSLPTGLYLIHVGGSRFDSLYTVRFVTPAAPPLRIEVATARWTGSRFEFRWTTEAGRRYQVQYKNHLSDPTWSNVGSPITTSGPTASVADPVSDQRSRFYRVVRLD